MRPSRLLSGIVAAGLGLAALAAQAEPMRLANVFADNMVLTREMPAPVWGFAEPGEEITVEFAGQSKSAHAEANGRWQVTLDPLKASNEGRALIARSTKTGSITINNIVVGEVWLASGQSNMAAGAGEDTPKDDTPGVRITGVTSFYPAERAADIQGRARWTPASGKSATTGSAVGLAFARKLHKELGVPVGLVISAVGGTRIETWTRRGLLEQLPSEATYLAQRKAQLEKEKADDKPDNKGNDKVAGYLGGRFDGMIAPLAPFAIRGVIWYQGEDNARNFAAYRETLPAMIKDWRATWGRDFPFLLVQLPAYNADKKPDGTDWAAMRDVQAEIAQTVPGSGLAVTVDTSDPNELHPKNKHLVGQRLALTALKQVYGKADLIASGPVFDSVKYENGKAIVRFKELGGGLVSKPADQLQGFAIAGEDKRFVAAEAKIEGDTVVLSAPDVPKPVAVRYAWTNAPKAGLFNKADLPARPFRTDDWPLKP